MFSKRYRSLHFFAKEIVHHSSPNDGKGICNLSALVIRTSDMESRNEDEQATEVHSWRRPATRVPNDQAPVTRAVTFRKNISQFPRLWSLSRVTVLCVRVCICATVELAFTCVPSMWSRYCGSCPEKRSLSDTLYFETRFRGERAVAEISKSPNFFTECSCDKGIYSWLVIRDVVACSPMTFPLLAARAVLFSSRSLH